MALQKKFGDGTISYFDQGVKVTSESNLVLFTESEQFEHIFGSLDRIFRRRQAKAGNRSAFAGYRPA